MMRRSVLLAIILMSSMHACFSDGSNESTASPPSHTLWNNIVSAHVSADGFVSYTAIIKDSLKLNTYLDLLSRHHPNSSWTKEEQLSYWINAYNAFTVRIIIRNFPLESIKEIGPKLSIPFVNDVWEIDFIQIEDKLYNLNDIEHGIVRKQFDDPRIHFALNCASESCPQLRNEAFDARKLESQLDDQTRKFLSDKTKNQIAKSELKISKLFSWYKSDFTKNGSLVDFLNQYSTIDISQDSQIAYKSYSWQLNGK